MSTLKPAHLLFGVVSTGVGVAAAIWGQSLIAGNEAAANTIVTVFSILAGFLVAIMTLLGDDAVHPGSWRLASAQRGIVRAKLIRQKRLFYLYLTTLTLIFVDCLIRKPFPDVAAWVERVYFGLSCTSFLLSFRLPAALMEVQTERIDAVIGARRGSASKLERS